MCGLWDCKNRACFISWPGVIKLGLHRILYPAPALAEIWTNFRKGHIRRRPDMAAGYEAGYEVGFGHLSMHLPQCVIGQEFIDLQIR